MVAPDRIFLVPHTHYDAVWAFNKEDYYYINTELILKNAIDLIKKTADYKFTIEQTFLLEYIENNHPHLFSEIKSVIEKDRLAIAGGQYLLSDTMIPHGEVLIREITEGKKYIKEKFGKNIVVGWGADEFGFNAQLPQILKGCGYRFFAFRRGADSGKPSEFIWEGPDGSQILCHWMPLGYRAGLDLTKLYNAYTVLKKHAATGNIFMPSGSGVTLPQPETSSIVRKWNEDRGNVAKMEISTPEEFFVALEKSREKFKVRKGEMYSGRLSEVFPDCTSSRTWIKQGAKMYENAILTLERWNTIARLIPGCPDFSEQLVNYWRNILFIAMHDVVPGTGIDEVYNEVREIFHSAGDTIMKSIRDCMVSIATKLAAGASNKIVVVFNSLSWQVKNWVECTLEFEEGQMKGISHLRSEGETFEIDILQYSMYENGSGIKNATIGFMAKIPALGFRMFEVIPGDERTGITTSLASDTSFSTDNFDVKIDPETGIIRIHHEGEDFGEGNELRLEEELGDLYYHKDTIGLMKSETGEGIKYGAFKAEGYEVEKGRTRHIIRFKSKYYALRWPYRLTEKYKSMIYRHNFIDIEKEIIIYRDLDRIDFVTSVDDRHPHSRLRVRFDVPVGHGKSYWCGTQFGAISRKADLYYRKDEKGWKEKPSGVFPSFEWVDCSSGGAKKDKGISLLHQGTPSHEVRDGKLYLTLLRSIVLLSADGTKGPCIPTPDANEMGRHTFRYSILPHRKSWREAETYRRAAEVNMPLVAVQLGTVPDHDNHERQPQMRYSFLEIEPRNILLSTIKPAAPDGRSKMPSIIVRLYETEGRKTIARLRFDRPVKKVQLLDLLENELDEGTDIGRETVELEVHPFKIVTLKAQF